MAFENFTVSIVSFPSFEGVDFTIENPKAVLQIIPNPGYMVLPTDFAAVSPLPNFVSSVVFTGTGGGSNVECTITYTEPSIMPANDVLVAVCATGFATLFPVTINGEIIACEEANTTNQFPTTYSVAGVEDVEELIHFSTVFANSGFYFATIPTMAVTIGNPSSYSITTFESTNSENQVISVAFYVRYSFPYPSVTGDKICLTAIGTPIYNPPVEIQSYSLPLNNPTLRQEGQTSNLTLNGIEGAQWNFQTLNSGGTIISNDAGTIDQTGTVDVVIVFPQVTSDEVYTLTLTGDLASSFDTSAGQPSVITIYQYVDTDLRFAFSSTDSRIVVGTPGIKTFSPFQEVAATQSYETQASSTEPIVLSSQPLLTDWSGGGGDYYPSDLTYNTEVVKAVFTIDNNNTGGLSTIKAQLIVDIDQVGTPDLSRILNLDNYVEQNNLTAISLHPGSNSGDACCVNSASTFFIDSSETFSTATVILLSDGVTAAPDQLYRSGSEYREQSGGALLAGSTTCSACRTAVSACFSSTSEQVCCGTSTSVIIYIDTGYNFNNAPDFYANQSDNTIAPTGYYSKTSGTCSNQNPQ